MRKRHRQTTAPRAHATIPERSNAPHAGRLPGTQRNSANPRSPVSGFQFSRCREERMYRRFQSLLLVTAFVLAHAAEAAGAVPNIVIIYADDLGYGDVSCYNPTRGKIPTPHIDRLASQGMRFTDGHSSSGVCSPSRYTILTGRYHWRTRLQSGIVGTFGTPLIAPDRVTIAGMLKQNGYQTACIGISVGTGQSSRANDGCLQQALSSRLKRRTQKRCPRQRCIAPPGITRSRRR